MNDRVFIDTNVLVYLFDDSEPEKQDKARKRLAAEKRAGELVVSTQVLQELYNALTRGKDPIRLPEDAEIAVRDAAMLMVVHVDPTLIFAAISQSRNNRLSFWDALIIEAAAAAGCSRILTEDLNEGQAYGTVRIENPFASSTAAPARAARKKKS